MTATCGVCGRMFDSHDGGDVVDETPVCPRCEKAVEFGGLSSAEMHEDFGGTFDGFRVSSDADPGL